MGYRFLPAEVERFARFRVCLDVADDVRPAFGGFLERRVVIGPLVVNKRQLRGFAYRFEGNRDAGLQLRVVRVVGRSWMLGRAEHFIRFVGENFAVDMNRFIAVGARTDIFVGAAYFESRAKDGSEEDRFRTFGRDERLPYFFRCCPDVYHVFQFHD